jgi:CRISPR-associated protein Csx10
MRADFVLELLTDVSLSAAARTLGAHETLDYVPGRVLWGVAASRAYASGMDEAEAFRLFQQGAVRFFDAVPCLTSASGSDLEGATEWRRAAPTPRSWHRRKYGTEEVRNFVFPEQRREAEGQQFEQLPTDWRAPSGAVVHTASSFTMRTAVEPTGRAKTGLLFGMAAIQAGTRLHACVDGSEADVELVCALLAGECRVGRSRSAEYGLVSIRRLDGAVSSLRDAPARSVDRVAILCLSRLALRDPLTGAGTFLPVPSAFRLGDGWEFDLESSFVRTASYSPYHQKRGRPESERAVIEHGSVLVFERKFPGPDVSLDELRPLLSGGAGEWRHQGLGEVAVDPEWLTEARPKFPEEEATAQLPPPLVPDDELYRWASEQADLRRSAREQFNWAERNARAMGAFGLPASQWGMLRALARQARYRADGPRWLASELERLLGRGVRALSGRWGKRVQGTTAAQTLLDALKDAGAELPVRLELLAGRAARPVEEDRGGSR